MDETWAGCPEPDLDRLTNFTKGCECNDTNPALFTDYHDLVRTALLPQSSGGILTFVNGHDASTILVTATSVLTITGTVDSITPSSISPGTVGPSASPADAIGLTTGTKVGIGAGVAGTALLFGIIAVLAWILRKRSRGNNHGPDPKQSPPPNSESYSDPTSPSVIDSQMSTPGLSGFKAELAADGPPSGGALVSPMTPGSPQFQCRPRQFEAYNPDLHGNYSHYRNRSDTVSPLRDTVYGSVFSVSPQHTGSTQDHTMAGTERTGQHPMEPIVELQG